MARLTVSEICYLLDALPLDESTRRALRMAGVPLVGRLTTDQIDSIRDLCGARLQAVGFNSKYDPTAEGRILEALIDKLFTGRDGDRTN